jgi:hypothetical protein
MLKFQCGLCSHNFPTKTHLQHHHKLVHKGLVLDIKKLTLGDVSLIEHYFTSDHICGSVCGNYPGVEVSGVRPYFYNECETVLLDLQATERKKLPEAFPGFDDEDIVEIGRKPASSIKFKYWRQKKAFSRLLAVEKNLQESYTELSLADLLFCLLDHKLGYKYLQQFLPGSVFNKLTAKITEKFYRSVLVDIDELLIVCGDMLLSHKNYQIFQCMFAGVYPLLPPLHDYRERKRLWSNVTIELIGLEGIKNEKSKVIGSVVSVSKVTELVVHTIEKLCQPVKFPIQCDCQQASCNCLGVAIWKEAKDGRTVGKRAEVLHSITPMFAVEPQSVYSNFIVSLVEGTESWETFENTYSTKAGRLIIELEELREVLTLRIFL